MARAVGLPARVAVGFTPGELGDDGLYHVRGQNAHAWPEVYLGGYGWVAFEPTPGRGRPGAEAYTGVAEAQADVANPSTATTASSVTTPPTVPEAPAPPTIPRHEQLETDGSGGVLPEEQQANPWLRVLVVGLVVLLAWAVVVPLLLRARRARRRSAASTPGSGCWSRGRRRARRWPRSGTARRPAETVTSTPARATSAPLSELARATALASYSDGSLPPETVARAVASATAVQAEVTAAAGWRDRLRWQFDPRPLVPSRTREITGKAGCRRAAA